MTELEEFIARCQEGLGHQVRGDSGPFLEFWSHADDVAILGAVGSYARGWEAVRAHILGAGKTLKAFDWTDLKVEDILTTAADGLAVWVGLERMTREVNGGTEGRTLRTTQVYRREDGRWRLILRHANGVTADDESREQSLLVDDEA
jgi:ketosteroid isomerase-like protein